MTAERPGRYFSWAELTSSPTARRRAINNEPNEQQRRNLVRLCADVLDPLRHHLGLPIHVTSGFRSEVLNTLIGGSSTSRHRDGLAADIKVAAMHSRDVAATIRRLGLPVDQVVWYDPERGGHLHVGLTAAGKAPRGMYLHAPSSGGYRAWE